MSTSASPTLEMQKTQSGGKIYEYAIILILALVQFSFLMDYIFFMSLGHQLMVDFNIGPRQYSFLISAYTFSAAVFGFISAFFVDRFDRKKILIACYVGFCLGLFLCAMSTNYYFLFFGRLFTGAFGGVLSATIMTSLGDTISKSRLGVATSIVIGANSVAAIIGVPVGLYLTHHFDWHIAFTILAFLNIVVLIMSFIFLPSMTTHIEHNKAGTTLRLFMLFKRSNFLWTIVFMCLLTLAGGFTILPFLSTYMITNVSFDPAHLSFLFFFGGLATIITGPMVGLLLDRFSKQGVFMIFNFISILPVFFLTIYPLTSHLMALIVSTAFFIFSSARHVSAMALINSKFEGNIRGKVISINSSMQMMAGSLSTVTAGLILYKSEGDLVNFDIVGIVAIMAIILCILVAFTLDND